MVTAQRDYYEILGVPRDADGKKIKDAFRQLTMKYHPDRNKSPDAEEKFKEIAEAYAILSDPKKRADYDAGGFEGVADYSTEDLFSGINFGDIFGDMGFGFDFGGDSFFDRFFNRQRQASRRGRDIEVQLVVDLNMINNGGEESIRLNHPITCQACKGSGAEPGTKPRKCEACGGSGQKVTSRKESKDNGNVVFQQISVCPVCHGQGTFIDKPCKQCQGTGEQQKPEALKIKIPRGAEEGMALRVSGHGMPSPVSNGVPGDLYVIIRTASDPRFQRLGADLWRTETINVTDAVLGTQVEIPTLKKNIKLKIPAGTQHNEVLRLRNKGLPIYGRDEYGDLKIRIQIAIPEELSDEERQLYEQLRELNKAKKHHWWN